MATSIRLRRGNKINLPSAAPSGMPLWCEDTKELYIGTDDGVEKIGSNNFSNIKRVNILQSASTIDLEDNSINRITLYNNCTMNFPQITDHTVFHQILIQIQMSYGYSITFSETYSYLNGEIPDLSQAGTYNIICEHNGSNWSIAAIKQKFVCPSELPWEDEYVDEEPPSLL